MARYRVVRRLPAVYSEVYEVDASNPEEAERALAGGRAQFRLRSFTTTPGTFQPAGFSVIVLREDQPAQPGDFAYPDVEFKASKEFLNATFHDIPGGDLQHATHEAKE